MPWPVGPMNFLNSWDAFQKYIFVRKDVWKTLKHLKIGYDNHIKDSTDEELKTYVQLTL